jgi:hypothetical protein
MPVAAQGGRGSRGRHGLAGQRFIAATASRGVRASAASAPRQRLPAGQEIRRPNAGSVISMRIRADSASGTPSRSKMSSACLNTIRAA